MNRSRLSLKAIMLVSGRGLGATVIGGSQPVAAQSYFDDYSCPAGYIYDPSYGCTLSGCAYEPNDYGYYGYLPYGYGAFGVRRHDLGHGFAHGMGGGFAHGLGDGMPHGAGFAHAGGGGFGHGMIGGFSHGGGGGHR